VILSGTHQKTLDIIGLVTLRQHALDAVH